MTTLFGVPLFGTLSVPLAVGIVTIFLFWTFVLSKKSLLSTGPNDELQKNVSENLVLKTKGKIKRQKKKKCGSNDGCCSKNDGKSGGCSSTNGAIETAKVFVDRHSKICQECAGILSKQWTESLTTELINVSEAEEIDLTIHADGSLCVFLTDVSTLNEQNHWILKAVTNLSKGEKPLAGMKYSAFTIQLPAQLERSKVDVIDQLLHKSGAVRVCRAETAEVSEAVSSSVFDDWADELLAQVERWNTPKKTKCKCGPKKKTNENDGLHSSSSKCSGSENEDKIQSSPPVPVLDLEDIAKLL